MQSNFSRLMKFVKPYWFKMAQAILLMLVSLAIGIALPWVGAQLVGGILPDGLVALKQGDTAEVLRLKIKLTHWIGLMIAIHLLSHAISYSRDMTLTVVAQRVLFDIRTQMFRHLQRLSLRYYETHQTGRIMARVMSDVDALNQLVGGGLANLIMSVAQVIALMFFLFYINTVLAIVTVIVVPIYIGNFLLLRRRIRNVGILSRQKNSQIFGSLYERLGGIRVVKSFGREQSETRRFVQDMRENFGLGIRMTKLNVTLWLIASLLGTAASLFILWYGGMLVLSGGMDLPKLLAFNSYAAMLFGPILTLVTINANIQAALAAVDRIFELLDTQPEVIDKPKAIIFDPARVRGEVAFRNVWFSYEPGEPVLKDISFTSPAGSVTALVGPSGGGKSTVVSLIPRFYDPERGSILLDGHDLKDIKLSSLRRQIGMVLQDTYLFSGTLRENIMYGAPEASEDDLLEAAIAANCHDFIMEMPHKYDTEIGERGTRLSGGQRQRIAIARAILRNPKVLILDEATSALDTESERLIQEALDNLMQNRTTFAIAHRLSTVLNADQILVIEDGLVSQAGKHEELLEEGGTYKRLYEMQFSKALEGQVLT